MNTSQAIVVEELTKHFGEFVAVDRINFSVSEGEIFGWLGPNGAGKTTTIRMLLGLIKPTSGRASVLGYDPAKETKIMQAEVGYMSQQFTLYNELTARENIRFYGQVYGLSSARLKQRQDELLEMAGLHKQANVITGNLSGGWKQRLALGCAIVHQPRIIFLDEPTAGVDPVNRREFWELIYGMARQRVTVLVTTHYMDEAELCQRVGFISQGRLVALDSPHRLKQTQMRGRVLEINSPVPDQVMLVLRTAQQNGDLFLGEVALYGAQVHAVVLAGEEYRQVIRQTLEHGCVPILSMDWIEPTLEDVFISAVNAPR
jgi:ABC-2 type transport system ATP-binding protein